MNLYRHFVRYIHYPLTQMIKGERVVKYLAILQANEHKSLAELEELQWTRLKHLLNDAYQSVPYYRALFDQHQIHPEDIRAPQDFAQIPFLTKTIIVEQKDQLLNTSYIGKIYPGKTSGSTGIPLTFYCTSEYSSWDWASRWRGRGWFGVRIGDPEVAIWGRPLYSTIRRFTDPLKARLRNTLLISGFDYNPDFLSVTAQKIRTFNPYYIYGYSNSIYHLAIFFLENNLPRLPQLKAIFVTAETLFPHERAVVEQAFGVPVANEYGCSEIGGFAYECPSGSWHVSIENVYLEFIENELGAKEIVGTALTNSYMPFIRYRIGDIGEWKAQPCSCGCPLPVMQLHTGKATDTVVTQSGKRYSSEIFDYLNLALLDLQRRPFKQYQIIQTKPSTFTIRYVRSNEFLESDLALFRKIFQNTMPDSELQLEFEQVLEIQPESSGKIRYFISKL